MQNNDQNNIKGIHINQLNTGMLIISCVIFFLILLATIQVSSRYQSLITAAHKYIECEKDVALIEDGSDYLSEQVRLYVMTKDKKHADNYFTELNKTRRREQGVENMINFDISPDSLNFLVHALEYSNRLTKREIYAMKLVTVACGYDQSQFAQEIQDAALSDEDLKLSPEEMITAAQNLVFDASYQDAKSLISVYTSYIGNSVTTNTLKEHEDNAQALQEIMVKQRLLLIALFIINCLTFLTIILLVIRPLKAYLKNIREDTAMDLSGAYEFQYLASTYNNIYELNASNKEQLRYKAEHDPLTGLLNRSILEALKNMLGIRSTKLALLLLDVDHFKSINDEYGHGVGDRMLQKIAQLLNTNFRTQDFIVRMGGDEFSIIMLNVTTDQKELIAQKIAHINDILQNPEDDLPPASLSVGVAFSEDGLDDNLYKLADHALYSVKKCGRCDCHFYEDIVSENFDKNFSQVEHA